VGKDSVDFEQPDKERDPSLPKGRVSDGSSELPEWPAPRHVLADFLEKMGVTQPQRISGRLLRDFGSVSGVLSASWWSLRRSVGHRLASVIRASRDLMQSSLVEEASKGPVIGSRREVTRLLQFYLGSLRRERVIALYVDASLHLIRMERISDGSGSDAPLDVSKIIHTALDVGASGFLIVHNHPSGDTTPSRWDINATQRLSRIAADLDLHLVDALIVAGSEVRSILGPFRPRGGDDQQE
jgi:DNA repair protein RadC